MGVLAGAERFNDGEDAALVSDITGRGNTGKVRCKNRAGKVGNSNEYSSGRASKNA